MDNILGYKQIPVKTWFLRFEGTIPDFSSFEKSVHVTIWQNPNVEQYLELYEKIGGIWGWTGRLLKTREELELILNSDNNEVWFFSVDDKVAGFFELDRLEQETEIVYLGLKPEWIGKGFGLKIIKAAIATAGKNGNRVWLHTCERDHHLALYTYQKAGFTIAKELILLEYYPEE